MKLVQSGPRADRMHVDKCSECPFRFLGIDETQYCEHPAYDGDYRFLGDHDVKLPTSPSWCELRGKVLMIGGPT